MSKSDKDYSFDDVYVSLTDKYKHDISSISEEMMTARTSFSEGKKRKKKKEKKESLPAEVLKDIRIIKMRSALDSKRFYKRNTFARMENVQVGTVIDSPADFYHSRLPKKMRKQTLVDQLLADAQFKKDIKKRYLKIVEEKPFKYKKQMRHKKHWKNVKEKVNKK